MGFLGGKKKHQNNILPLFWLISRIFWWYFSFASAALASCPWSSCWLCSCTRSGALVQDVGLIHMLQAWRDGCNLLFFHRTVWQKKGLYGISAVKLCLSTVPFKHASYVFFLKSSIKTLHCSVGERGLQFSVGASREFVRANIFTLWELFICQQFILLWLPLLNAPFKLSLCYMVADKFILSLWTSDCKCSSTDILSEVHGIPVRHDQFSKYYESVFRAFYGARQGNSFPLKFVFLLFG